MRLERGKLAEKILKNQVIDLSSNFTKFGTLGAVVMALVTMYYVWSKIMNATGKLEIPMILGGILSIGLVALTLFLLRFMSEAQLKGKTLKVKKIIGKSHEIDIAEITKISTYTTRSTKYTYVKFKDNRGIEDKTIIMNSNSLLWGSETSAGDIIKLAQQL